MCVCEFNCVWLHRGLHNAHLIIIMLSFSGVFFDPVLYTPVEEQVLQILTIRSVRPVSSDSRVRVYNRDMFFLAAISMSVEYCVITSFTCSHRSTILFVTFHIVSTVTYNM